MRRPWPALLVRLPSPTHHANDRHMHGREKYKRGCPCLRLGRGVHLAGLPETVWAQDNESSQSCRQKAVSVTLQATDATNQIQGAKATCSMEAQREAQLQPEP